MIKSTKKLRRNGASMSLGMLLCLGLYAAPSSLQQTQSQLKQIDVQINNLQQTLTTAHDKRGALNHELSVTAKQISKSVHELITIQKTLDNKRTKITLLQKQVNQLSEQLTAQQQLLANHVRARYQMGEYQPLKWLLNQDDPYKVSRILTYYQYIIKSRQQLIAQVDATRNELTQSKKVLNNELAAAQNLNRN